MIRCIPSGGTAGMAISVGWFWDPSRAVSRPAPSRSCAAEPLAEPPAVPFEIARLVSPIGPPIGAVVLGFRLAHDARSRRARACAGRLDVVDIGEQCLGVGAADGARALAALHAAGGSDHHHAAAEDQLGMDDAALA